MKSMGSVARDLKLQTKKTLLLYIIGHMLHSYKFALFYWKLIYIPVKILNRKKWQSKLKILIWVGFLKKCRIDQYLFIIEFVKIVKYL